LTGVDRREPFKEGQFRESRPDMFDSRKKAITRQAFPELFIFPPITAAWVSTIGLNFPP
jgi:hypothetical protein